MPALKQMSRPETPGWRWGVTGWLLVSAVLIGGEVIGLRKLSEYPPIGLALYRGIVSQGPSSIVAGLCSQGLKMKPSHPLLLTATPNIAVGIRVDIQGDSITIPKHVSEILLRWIPNGPAASHEAKHHRIISRVEYSYGSNAAGQLTKVAKFIRTGENPHTPEGEIEIHDWSNMRSYFAVPDSARAITIYLADGRTSRRLAVVYLARPHLLYGWIAVSDRVAPNLDSLTDPRVFLKGFIHGAKWGGLASGDGTRQVVLVIRNALSVYGYSTSDITLLTKNIVRRELASATDLQLFKEVLASNGSGLRKQTELGKAIWLTLLATLKPLICSSNGTVAWIHLRNGRLLCFVGGNTGYGVWQFGESGELLANGLVWFTDIGKWPQTRRVKALMSEFIPFFSQPPPASLARRSETGR